MVPHDVAVRQRQTLGMDDQTIAISHGCWSAGLGHHDGRLSVRWLRRDGADLLAPEGCPLIGPWFGRLRGHGYDHDGLVVDLDPADPHLDHDEVGRPLHGLRTDRSDWTIGAAGPARAIASTTAWTGPTFPFSHRIVVTATLSDAGLEVATTLLVHEDARIAVPVGFAWHPYLVVGDDAPETWRISLPFLDQVVLEDLLPTGTTVPTAPEVEALRARDDCFVAQVGQSATITGATSRTTIDLVEGFGWAMVWSPQAGGFLCIEPMAGPLLALDGDPDTIEIPPGHQLDTMFRIH